MQKIITAYETTRTVLLGRIHELNEELLSKELHTQERELLEQRKELLTIETIEILHIIADLRRHQ